MVITTGDVVAWYDIEDNTGTDLLDNSANSNNFSFSAAPPAWVTDAPTGLTYSLDFVTADRVPMGSSLIPNSAFSLAAWVKFDTDGVNSHVFGRNASFLFGTQSGDKSASRIYDGYAWSTISNSGTTVTTWQHLVITWNGSSTMAMYTDGAASGSTTQNSMANTGATLYMGAYNPTSDGRYMDGHIAQAQIFNKALTSTEVTALYNLGTAQTYNSFFASGTNAQINIGDAWKSIEGMQINIGDSWKVVEGAQVNIGDSWKTIF